MAFLGLLLVQKMLAAALSRQDVTESDRKDFFFYADEFQNFATDDFCTILSEARKYRLNLTMAHQYIGQLPDNIKDAVFGNVGIKNSLRFGIIFVTLLPLFSVYYYLRKFSGQHDYLLLALCCLIIMGFILLCGNFSSSFMLSYPADLMLNLILLQ